MTKHLIRRLLQAVPTLFGITVISFLLMQAAPGDPVSMLTFNPEVTAEGSARLRRQLGLDDPPLTQYLYWLVGNDWTQIDVDGDGSGDVQGVRKGLLRGDLGNSLVQKRPVLELITERIPATMQLMLSALLVGYSAGIVLGLIAAARHGSVIDQAIRFFSVVGTSLPGFWLGLLLIIIFSVQLKWLPLGGRQDLTDPDAGLALWDVASHMILPVSVLAMGIVASISRYVRAEALEIMGHDYIRTARAKGLNERSVFRSHVMRNALIPVATLLGPALGGLIGGSVITEQVFSWPGMGRMVITAISQRDFPLIMGTVLFSSVIFTLGVLLSDILYGLLDPRVRY
ncbi:MAG: ABC transporter permease [Anaerolineae bacterium]|nr:ABC transporter permease [Anaerolineae bacterium]NUQ07133.1 ABC transporter permease [Anaerolineae bacterium]